MKGTVLLTMVLGLGSAAGVYFFAPAMATMQEVHQTSEIFRSYYMDPDKNEKMTSFAHQCRKEQPANPISRHATEDENLQIQTCSLLAHVFMLRESGTYTDEETMYRYLNFYSQQLKACDTGDRQGYEFDILYLEKVLIPCAAEQTERYTTQFNDASLFERKLQFIKSILN